MKDREQRLGMADSPIEFEQTPVDPEEFVVKAVTDVGGRVAHWGVGPATDIDRSLLLKKPWQALAQVPVLDPKLRFTPEELKNPTDETLSLAVPLFLAKSQQVEEEITLSPKERKGLEKNKKSVLSLLGSKGRNTAAALAMLTAACSPAITPPEISPTPTLEPTPANVFEIPSQEEIVSLEASVQAKLDETFPNIGLHETRMQGGGFLEDSLGRRYAFFETLLPDPTSGFNLNLTLLSEVGEDNSISWVKGLVLATEAQTGEFIEFLGVSYDLANNQFVVEGPLIRTSTIGGDIDIYREDSWQPLLGPNETVDRVYARLGSGVLAAPALPTPTISPEPTSTEVPPAYEIVEGYKEEVREETLSVPVSIDIITDESLQDRHPVNHPIERLFLNKERFPNASQDISEATMRAIWYAWKDDAPDERDSVTFENYMEMVKEYIDGERPLSDVEYQVWANDLQTAVFKTEVFSFDPTQPIKIVYLDELATENISYVSPGNRSGIQRNSDGNLEIWLAYPKDRIRYSFWSTILYVQSLNRLTWPSEYQQANPKRIDGSEVFYDPSKYHSDVHNKLIRTTTSSGWGVIAPDPNDWD